VANHRLLDRLVRGRASIGIVAFALMAVLLLVRPSGLFGSLEAR